MVYSYHRKTDRGGWDQNNMIKALEAVRNKQMGWALASKTFNVPATTLRRRAANKNKIALNAKKHLGRYDNALPDHIEKAIVTNILELESQLFGLTPNDVCSLAYQIAEQMKIKHPFSKEKKKAGISWLKGFRKRNPEISLRLPEATSLARAQAFNKPQIEKYFKNLEKVRTEHQIDNTMIFNMDESALTTVQSPPKVFAKKGKKQVGAITSAERGTHTTVVVCMSSGGNFVPPAIIFHRKKRNDLLYDGAPVGTLGLYNESGYMTGELFLKWIKHFIDFVRPSENKKALLILDGHLSHKYFEALQLAKEKNVIIFCLPAHCTYRLQPLDVAFFGPLQTYYNQAVTDWMRANPGRPVTIYQIAALFNKAYEKTATPAIALSGFRSTGIAPFNRDIFPEHLFVPSTTTDIPIVDEDHDEQANIEAPTTSGVRPVVKDKSLVSINEENSQVTNNTCPSMTALDGDIKAPSKIIVQEAKLLVDKLSPKPRCVTRKPKTSRKGTKYQAVLTVGPFIQELKEKEATKKISEERKSKRNIVKRKIVESSDEDEPQIFRHNSDDEDAACLYCNELYSRSKSREMWLKCQQCEMWAHAECAGLPKNAKQFTCELCTV